MPRLLPVVVAGLLAWSATGAAAQPAFTPQISSYLTATAGATARIADHSGRTVILRGINVVQIGDYFQQDPSQPPRFDLTEEDLADIAALGFNHVRLIIHWSLLEPAPGDHSPEYLATIRQALEWARNHDLHVVLDMHQDAWGKHIATPPDETCLPGFDSAVGWDGAPEWATITNGLPTCKATLRELSPAVGAAWQNFYDDADPGDGVGIQTRLVDTWAWLVDELGSDPVIAGYDLLNEPNPGFLVGLGQTVALGAFYGRTIDAIRAAEAADERPMPGAAFFEPGVEWSAAGITVVPPPTFTDDTAIVFAPHIYAESIAPNSIEDGWQNAEDAAALYGATVWSGEWGYFNDPADNDEQLRRFAAEEDDRLLHSAFWDWRQACGDPHNFYTDRFTQKTLSPSLVRYACPGDVELGIPVEFSRMLSRPYPRAVPGRLDSIESNIDTGELVVQGSTPAPGRADLWFPDRGTGSPVVTGGHDVVVHRVPATERAAGGWRVQMTVEGDWTISGSLSGSSALTPLPTGNGSRPTLPATGGGLTLAAALLLTASRRDRITP